MSLRIHINPNSGVALYRQIADEVKAAFLRGFIKPGERLPSVRELAVELGMNPTTIVKAYDLLEHERLINRRQGKGAFVADGQQPLHPEERSAHLVKLSKQLAIEGRRLGLSETELVSLLKDELRTLRPTKRRN